jgi:hypothetical protein
MGFIVKKIVYKCILVKRIVVLKMQEPGKKERGGHGGPPHPRLFP